MEGLSVGFWPAFIFTKWKKQNFGDLADICALA